MDKIENILKAINFSYDHEFDKENNLDIYYSGITTELNKELDVLFIVNNRFKTFTIYIPEIIKIPLELRQTVLLELNNLNSNTLYGAFFLRNDQDSISYKTSHSLEGHNKININKEQIEDYISMICVFSDLIIETVGKLTSELD